MEQFEKGYSVLENIPEEKDALVKNEVKPIQKEVKLHILRHWSIFMLLVILVFLWVFFLAHLFAWNNSGFPGVQHAETTFDDEQFQENLDETLEFKSSADILEALHEKDAIQGAAWDAWNTLEDDSEQQAICKFDNGVSNSGADFVLKRFTTYSSVDSYKNPSQTYVDPTPFIPQGTNLTGLIAIDHRKSGDDGCYLETVGSTVIVRLESKNPPAIRFTILLIGRKSGVQESKVEKAGVSGGESLFAELIKYNETGSEEEFGEFMYGGN